MRNTVRRVARVVSGALLVAVPVSAQSARRDSAGIHVVTSTRPAWTDGRRLMVESIPRLVIGDAADSSDRLAWVKSVMVLSDGNIAVADGASLQLRLYAPDGRFLSAEGGRGDGPGRMERMNFVRRMRGDTIAIATDVSTLQLFSGSARYARTLALPRTAAGGGPRSIMFEVMRDGRRLVAPLAQPDARAPGTRWVDSMDLQLVAPDDTVLQTLRDFPCFDMQQTESGPVPRWLSATCTFASGDDHFFGGFGDRYEIRAYDGGGALRSIIRRAWTPAPITRADWEHWVVEWSKRWITSTGEQRHRDVQGMREAPYARVAPAFSQFIVDRTGRLWVREAHWQDAIGAGSLTDYPEVPSRWSVFDAGGVWLCDVTMPENFEVHEIGNDYMAGRRRVTGGNQAVIYGLRSPIP